MKILFIIFTCAMCFSGFALQEEPRNRTKRMADTLFKDTMYKKGMDESKEIKQDSVNKKSKGTRARPKQK